MRGAFLILFVLLFFVQKCLILIAKCVTLFLRFKGIFVCFIYKIYSYSEITYIFSSFLCKILEFFFFMFKSAFNLKFMFFCSLKYEININIFLSITNCPSTIYLKIHIFLYLFVVPLSFTYQILIFEWAHVSTGEGLSL